MDEYLSDRIDSSGDCWEWTGTVTNTGYGLSNKRGLYRGAAHRAVWVSLIGAIPDGLDLDHLCRNTRCVNPDHLEPVTRSENMKRTRRNSRCVNGHLPVDLYTWTDGSTRCRPCGALHARNRRAVS